MKLIQNVGGQQEKIRIMLNKRNVMMFLNDKYQNDYQPLFLKYDKRTCLQLGVVQKPLTSLLQPYFIAFSPLIHSYTAADTPIFATFSHQTSALKFRLTDTVSLPLHILPFLIRCTTIDASSLQYCFVATHDHAQILLCISSTAIRLLRNY